MAAASPPAAREPYPLAVSTRADLPAAGGDRFLPLAGEVALVTGASRGIGAAVAANLSALGARVETAERTSGFDLRDPAEALRAVERLDRIDILVCNAGLVHRGPLLDTPLEEWQETLSLNLTTPFVMGQAAARRFLAQGSAGRIVHIASMRSFHAGQGAAAYAASKAGLVMLMKAQASEWARHGIRVNAVAPGWVATDLTAEWRTSPEKNASILERVPIGRWGEPAEIAEAVAWLCLPGSAFVNGHVLAADGGYLVR